MEIQLKKLEYEDIKIHEIQLKTYIKELIIPYTEKETSNETERIYKNMKKYTKDTSAIIIGAFNNKRLIGFIWGYKKEEEQKVVHINYFFVNEKYRSQGIGKELLNKIQSTISDCNELELLVNNKNSKALNFYKNNDFQVKEIYNDNFKLRKRINH